MASSIAYFVLPPEFNLRLFQYQKILFLAGSISTMPLIAVTARTSRTIALPLKLLAVLASIAIPVAVKAQDSLEGITVEATRLGADDIDTELQTGKVTVIKGDDIANKVATVADVLKSQTGVQIRQNGALGSFSTVYLRGATSKQVNVYLDGILLNDVSGGTVDLSQLPLSNIERIEIYRGLVPIQLAAGGMAGAINITSRTGSGSSSGKLVVGAGSFGAVKASGSLQGGTTSTQMLTSVEHLSGDNDFPFLNDNQTENNPFDDFSDRRNNAQFRQNSGLLNVRHEFGKDLVGRLVIQQFNKTQHLMDQRNLASTQAQLSTEHTGIQGSIQQWLDNGLNLTTKLYLSDKQDRFYDPQGRIGPGEEDARSIVKTAGASLLAAYGTGDHYLTATLDGKRASVESLDANSPILTEVVRKQWTLGLQDEWSTLDDTLLLNIGGRALHLADSAKNGANSTSDAHFSTQLGAIYTLNSHTELRANTAREIRPPLLGEKYGDFGFLEGNKNLEAETSQSSDIGIRWEKSNKEASFFYFFRNLNDAIVVEYDSSGIGRFQNISAAQVQGVELEASYRPHPVVNLTLRSTLQDSENQDGSRGRDGKQLAGLYRQAHSLEAALSWNTWESTFEYRHESGAYYDSSEFRQVPDKDILDWTLKWKQDRTAIEVTLHNLTDDQTEVFNGFAAPGRHFFATFSQSF